MSHRFFSKHDSHLFLPDLVFEILRLLPYQEPLSVVMQRTYELGNFNASLLATEGIASVGLLLAPIAVFVCGLVIALGNRVSAGLPAGFVM